MVNYIWVFFIVSGFMACAVQGKLDVFGEAVFEGAKTGVAVCLGLISVLVFWLGMMKIADDSGLLKVLAKLMRPLVRFLFPTIPRNHPSEGYIISNLSANLLGLGNAATPMGIKAMQELQKLNPHKDSPSPDMCTLLALNTSSLTIIPTTIIAIRMNFGSENPTEIVGTTLIATLLSTLTAIVVDRWYRKRHYSNRPGKG